MDIKQLCKLTREYELHLQLLLFISSRKKIKIMQDWEFEHQQDIECRVENFEESREWHTFTYAENEAYLTSLEHLDIYRYINIEICLNWSKDAYLVNKGYYKHPMGVKRNKYQKLKKNYEKLS